MKHTLHHYPLNETFLVKLRHFATFYELLEQIEISITGPRSNDEVVFLFTDSEEVFITSNPSMVFNTLNALKTYFDLETESNIFVGEYSSYEEAYEAAMDWKEDNALCYDQNRSDEFQIFAN